MQFFFHSDEAQTFGNLLGNQKNVCYCHKYRLDTKTKGHKLFMNLRAPSCSAPSVARALLGARGFIKSLCPIGRGI